MKKTASAVWQGDLKNGKGSISTQSGALKSQPYGFKTRFEDEPGTNPKNSLGRPTRVVFPWRYPMCWVRQG